jgi:hypothetical protein
MARAGSATGGTHVVEWKESWRDDYLRWLCGFANADGGMLVIGRNDKGELSPPKALTPKRAERVERLRLHDHLARIATADDGCAVTSESWLPVQLVVGRKTGYGEPYDRAIAKT